MKKKPKTKKSQTKSSNQDEKWIRLNEAGLEYLKNMLEQEDTSFEEEFDREDLEMIQDIAEDESVSILEARKILEKSKSIPEEERFKPNLEALPRAMQMIADYHSRENIKPKPIWIPDLVRDYIRNLRNPI